MGIFKFSRNKFLTKYRYFYIIIRVLLFLSVTHEQHNPLPKSLFLEEGLWFVITFGNKSGMWKTWSYRNSAPHFHISHLMERRGLGINPLQFATERAWANWQQQQQQQFLQHKVPSTDIFMAKYKPWLVCCFIFAGLICVALICLCVASFAAGGCASGSFRHAAVAADSRLCSEIGR